MITPIQGIQPIAVKPFAEIPTEMHEQDKGLDPGKYNDLLTTLNSKIKAKEDADVKKDKVSPAKFDYKELASRLKSLLGDESLTIEFSLDQDTRKMILKFIDPATKETVQQFPSEIALKIARIVAASLTATGQGTTNAKI